MFAGEAPRMARVRKWLLRLFLRDELEAVGDSGACPSFPSLLSKYKIEFIQNCITSTAEYGQDPLVGVRERYLLLAVCATPVTISWSGVLQGRPDAAEVD